MVRGGTPRGARAAEAVGDTAEVVFLGELTGATGFKHTCRGSVLCKYVVVHGEHWHLDKGAVSGATQAAATAENGGELAPWGHPFQLSFNTTSVRGWPKLLFAVYERDAFAAVDSFVGYGVCALPLTPGTHEMSACAFAVGDRNARLTQNMREYFNNVRPELEGWRTSMLHREEMHAAPVVTVGMGEVHLKIAVLCKNLDVSGLRVRPVMGNPRRPGGRSPRGGRSPARGDRSPTRPRGSSPSPSRESSEDAGNARLRGLHSVRRRFEDAAKDVASVSEYAAPSLSESDGDVSVDAFSAATRLGRAGAPVPAAGGVGGRRARRARASGGEATAALVSERRARAATDGGRSGGDSEMGQPPETQSFAPETQTRTYAHQRETIEDAPLASGREVTADASAEAAPRDSGRIPGGRRRRTAGGS